jgi:hypothetical protein
MASLYTLWRPFLVCFLLAIGMTAPTWLADTPSLIGHWGALDLPGSVWAHWWVAHCLSVGANPFIDTMSFVPFGLSPVHQYNLLDAILGSPWVLLAGTRVGYNLATLAALTTTGMGGYALARSTGTGMRGALFTAVAIQASSAVSLELYEGRLSQFLLVYFLLALASLVTLIRTGGGLRIAIVLGVCAAATAGIYWYAATYFLPAACIIVLAHRHTLGRKHCTWIAVAGLIGLGLILPFVIDLLGSWNTLPGMARNGSSTAAGGNLVSGLSGLQVATDNSRWPLWPLIGASNQEHGHQISPLVLVLSVFAFRWKQTGRWTWLGIAIVGWIMAMGPKLHGYNSTTDVSLPFAWVGMIFPPFERMWWPQRFEILCAIGLSVLAGAALERWLTNRPRANALWMASVLLIVLDSPLRSGVLPIQTSPTPTTNMALYTGLDGPIFTTPVWPNVGQLHRLRWLQTQHELAFQNGNGEHIPSHRPPQYTDWMNTNSMVRALNDLKMTRHLEARVEPDDIQHLIDAGFRYAVVDPYVYGETGGRIPAATHSRVFEQVWGSPIRTSRGGAVWRIEPIDAAIDISIQTARKHDRMVR